MELVVATYQWIRRCLNRYLWRFLFLALEARKAVEQQTGKSVITSQNAAQLNTVVTNVIDSVSKAVDEE